jgi:uncharacterized membrane protein YphA (DoxX/SURF4 family)
MIKLQPKLSNLQLWALVIFRVVIGWHFMYEGLVKLFTPSWTAMEYLSMARWWFAGFFNWIATTSWALAIADFINIYGLMAIGLALMLGVFTRIALWSGIVLLAMFYISYPPFIGFDYGVPNEGHYLIVNKTLIELLALVMLAIFPTSRQIGLDRLVKWLQIKRISKGQQTSSESAASVDLSPADMGRRAWLKSIATIPFVGAFAFTAMRKKSYEEKYLIDAVTGASIKAFDFGSLKDLKADIPKGTIKGIQFSRLILGGNLLSGWAHSRDLIYVSQLVRAYHHKDKIFATLLMAEKCGINTLLTNPVIAKTINEYWDRGIGKIQFISDCVGLNYTAEGATAAPYQEFLERIQMAIDHGACACYIQGETADYYMKYGNADAIGKAFDLMRKNGVIAGIGAHQIETIKACVDAGFDPDFWMKTLHHHNYWSAGHPKWYDNMYCFNPEETIAYMETLPQPWIAFKTLAAGAIKPADAFRYAFENGADFVCAGMYDFQMVEDANIALDVLNDATLAELRRREWMA